MTEQVTGQSSELDPRGEGRAPSKRPGKRELRPSKYRPDEVIADKYRLVRPLARGGMGEVWVALHESLQTDLAVKFLCDIPDDDGDTRDTVLARFRFEAQISARLGGSTKHIVAVHDAGTYKNDPYLVMEFVRGHTLESEIDERGTISPERLAAVLDQVADALSVAHGLGIVHRDLKPSNIMIIDGADSALTAKVADFGVAKAIRTDLAIARPKETSEGYLVGSPAYMSPEQLRADGSADARSDVWALGVVAYEALTGWPPFAGSSIADLIVAISTRHPDPPSAVRSTITPGIDAWFLKAMAKDPDERFASVKELAAAFRVALTEAPRRSYRRTVGVFAALAGLCLAVGLTVLLMKGGAPSDAQAQVVPPAPVAPVQETAQARPVATEVEPAVPPTSAVEVPPATTGRPPPAAREPRGRVAPTPPTPATAPRRRKEINPSEIQ